MKKTIKLSLICFLFLTSFAAVGQEQPERELGWTLSAHTYTFNRFTFAEALDKAAQAGLRSVEAFNGQEIGGGIEGKFTYQMDVATQQAVLDLLKEKGIELVAFGVVRGNTDEEWRQLFSFSKAMGIQYINSEPRAEYLPLVGQLADEFQIHVGIHNHPEPTTYWHPDIVLDAIATANSSYVGACADVGHWVRSGLEPVECLAQLEGHLKSMHFKDLKEKDRKTHDVHWGTGVANVPAIITELKRQNFHGNISAEYEYNWEDSVGDVTQSVKNFRAIVSGQ